MDEIQKKFDSLIKQLEDLGVNTRRLDAFRKQFKDAGKDIQQATDVLEDMSVAVKGLYFESVNVNTSFKDLTKILTENAQALQSTGQFIAKVGGALGKVRNIGYELLNDATGLVDLNRRDLQSRLDKLEVIQQELALASEQAKLQKEQLKRDFQSGKITEKVYKKQLADLEEIEKYNAREDAGITGIIGKLKDRLALEDEIEAKMGVTGALIEGTGALMERLGMRSGIFHTAMEKAAQTMRDMARATAENTANFSKLEIAAKGFSILAGGFSAALTDPATLVAAIGQGFLDVNKATVEAARLTGQYTTTLESGVNSRLVSTVDYLETVAELTKQVGMNAQNIFSPDVLAGAAELKNTMGLAANEAGGLATIAQTTTGDIDGVTNAIVDTTSQFNKANRSAVSQGQILRDVATAGEGVKASLSGNPKLLAQAASAARRLGMELSQLDSIASSLMDFESSIEAELEAQLLTGKNINMAKARELALNNDLAGLGKEIFKNSSDIAEFGKMNRIQQEAQAKALGMTRDQLAKVAYQRALEKGMTEDQAAAAANVNAEDMKRMAVQEKIAKAVEKLQQAFAPILDVVADIVDALAPAISFIGGMVGGIIKFLDKIYVLKPLVVSIMAAIAAKAVIGNLTAIGGKFGDIAKNAKGALGTVTELFKPGGIKAATESLSKYKDEFLSAFKGADKLKSEVGKVQSKAGEWFDADSPQGKMIRTAGGTKPLTETVAEEGKDKLKEKTKDLTGGASDKTLDAAKKSSEVPEAKSSGEKLKEFLTNLAAGLREMASMEVVGGALALIPASLGLTAMIPGYLGAKLLETLNGEKLKVSLEGLANGLKAMANGTAVLGALALIPAGLGFAAFTAGAIGMAAIALLGAPASAGLTALGIGLQAFGTAAMNPLTWAGVGLLAALGVALIPLGYAIGQVAPAIAAFGTIISSALSGIGGIITSIADGFSTMLSTLSMEKVASLFLLGPAFASIGLGLMSLSVAALYSLPALGVLGALALMGTGLEKTATSLSTIATSIKQISDAISTLELTKIEELKDLISTSAMAAPLLAAQGAITGLVGGTNAEKETTSSNTDAKLDELIAAVRAGQIVKVYTDPGAIKEWMEINTSQSE